MADIDAAPQSAKLSPVTRRQLAVLSPQLAPQVERPDPKLARISLTDRCDMACVYCRPEGGESYQEERLSTQGFRNLIAALRRQGVERFRITGGEPLLRRDLLERVADLAALSPTDLALTTNGSRLAALAKPLREAGLRRLTISIDSLQPERFQRLTRGAKLEKTLAGIEAACEAGFDEVKMNTVVLGGENDSELKALVTYAWARGITPRFIEVMKIGEGANMPRSSLVSVKEMQARLAHLVSGTGGMRDPNRGPARYLKSRCGTQRVGFISGSSDTYCENCDRLRVLANGDFISCLAVPDGVSAYSQAEAGDSNGVVEQLEFAWQRKPDGRYFRGCTEDSASLVSMRGTGG